MSLFAEQQGIGATMDLSTIEIPYRVYDTTGAVVDLNDARTWFALYAPATYGPLVKVDAKLDEDGPGLFLGTVTYGLYVEPATGGSEWSFEIGTQNTLITHSRSTINRYVASGSPADYKRRINVTREGVLGQEVPRPISSFSEVHYLDPAALTLAFRAVLQYAVGTMNAVPFRGYLAHEVLLAGISGSGRGRDNIQCTFRFDVSKNATGLAVGPITGIAKDGWDLLWVVNDEEEDTTANVITKVPRQVNVERIFDELDFATALGI